MFSIQQSDQKQIMFGVVLSFDKFFFFFQGEGDLLRFSY